MNSLIQQLRKYPKKKLKIYTQKRKGEGKRGNKSRDKQEEVTVISEFIPSITPAGHGRGIKLMLVLIPWRDLFN